MKITQLENDNRVIKITDLENMFNVYEDIDGNYYFNLNETVYFNVPYDAMLRFKCDCDMHWPIISYRIYGTTRLAWLLMKLNRVKCVDSFSAKKAGDDVYYVSKETLQPVIKQINSYE